MVRRKPKSSIKKPRRSARDIAKQADRILEEARQRAQENARLGMTTVTISREELILNLSGKTAHSPFLTSIGRGNAVRGATFLISFGVMQPDGWAVYSEGNLGLCYCWSDAGGLMDPGLALLQAEPTVGVVQVDIGILNSAAMPYDLVHPSHTHHLSPGPADLNYFLYLSDAFGPAVLLKRGTLRTVVT